MTLAKLVGDKVKELELSASAAATKAGVAYPSFAAVIAGKSVPNARTAKKYAKFLGLTAEQVAEMAQAEKGGGRKTAGRRARVGKPAGRGRGRGHASGGSLVASLQAAVRLASEAEALLADDLAVQVHALKGQQRAIIASILAGLR